MIANLITSHNYTNWYGMSAKKAYWIPLQHLVQMQHLLARMSMLANMPAMIQKVMTGKSLDPAPFLCLCNAASDFIRDIEVCTQLDSLDQIFAEPSSLYVAPDNVPSTTPTKHPKPGTTENKESGNQRKKKKLQQEGFLKMTTRRDFRSPPGLQTQIGPPCQHMTNRCGAILSALLLTLLLLK
eukprot:15346965-Ditylum_brightwellii.AAC.1